MPPPPVTASATLPPLNVAPYAPPPPPGGKSGLRTFLIVALVLLFVFIGLGITAAFYAVRAAKEKATSLMHSVQSAAAAVSPSNTPGPSNAAGPAAPAAAGALGAPDTPLTPTPAAFPPLTSASSPAPDGKGSAPPREGMLVITAIADERGDYESMKQITAIDAAGITLSYRSDKPKPGTGVQSSSGSQQETAASRKVLSQDLENAHDYAEMFGANDPESFPGTTAITASREVLAQLKQKGAAAFSFRPDGLKGALGSLLSTFGISNADTKDMGVAVDKLQKEQCSLQREGEGLFAFPVLLNGQPVTLPALRAACTTDDGPADFYILDQPDYPLMLSWKLGSGSRLQVIKITYPPPPRDRKTEQKPPASGIEQQLKEKKKVDIYGIYFDFASDRLKPESTPVLEEIAGVLKDNPDWILTVSGHTDNVGGDPYNLDLSKRRAAAVKQALVTEYKVAPGRLSTDGFGATRPVDTNDTLAGRARNRRVELTRQ